jgi:hypothetical protein
MNAEMSDKGAGLRKGLVALGTLEGLLIRMDSDMGDEVAALRKGLGAGETLEGLLLGVRTDVLRPISYHC